MPLSILSIRSNPDNFGYTAPLPVQVDGAILVHGIDTSDKKISTKWAALAGSLGLKNPMAFVWPSGDCPLSYPFDVSKANQSGYRLTDALYYGERTGATIITHSLGARVALAALNNRMIMVDKLIMMAPAVDRDAFQKEFSAAVECVGKIYVLHSKSDEVLRWAFPIGDFPGHHEAMGYEGPDTPLPANVQSIDVSQYKVNHDDYLTDPNVAKIVKGLL